MRNETVWPNSRSPALYCWYSSFISWLEDRLLGCPSVSSWGDLSFAGFGITGPRAGATPWKRHAGLSCRAASLNGLWCQWLGNHLYILWLLVLGEQVLLFWCKLWLKGPLQGLFWTPDACKQMNNWTAVGFIFNLPRYFSWCSFLPSRLTTWYLGFLEVITSNLEMRTFIWGLWPFFYGWDSVG